MISNKLRLKQPLASVREGLMYLITSGHFVYNEINAHPKDDGLVKKYDAWKDEALDFLYNSFPTQMEAGEFVNTQAQKCHYSRPYSDALRTRVDQLRCKLELIL